MKTDQFHTDFDRIVRIGTRWQFLSDGENWGDISFGEARPYHIPMMAADLREIESYTRFLAQPEFNKELVGHGEKITISVFDGQGNQTLFKEDQMVYADPNLFEFLNIPLILGSPAAVLEKPNAVVLSQSKAKSYFGNTDPVGRYLVLNDSSTLLLVTGVFEDLPVNTHLYFDLVISNVGVRKNWYGVNGGPFATCYVKVGPTVSIAKFEEAINRNKEKYLAVDLQDHLGYRMNFFVQPLTEIAFGPRFDYDFFFKKKSKSTLRLLVIVSVVILLMAWANYINLTLSTMRKRMKEIATRKVSGANSVDLLHQFVVEACLLNLLAVALSLTLMQLLNTPVELFLGIKSIPLESINPATWAVFCTVVATGVLVTGIYPAILSHSYGVKFFVSYARVTAKGKSLTLLTTGQYLAAVVLILWAFLVSLQLNFILDRNLGFDREQVVIVEAPLRKSKAYPADADAFMNTLRASPGVSDATWSYRLVTDANIQLIGVSRPDSTLGTIMFTYGGVDQGYIPFYGITLLAGRNFNANDKKTMILSRYATHRLGYKNPEDVIGEKILVGGAGVADVVGVIEDYRQKSLLYQAETNSETTSGSGIVLTCHGFLSWQEPEKFAIKLDLSGVDQTMGGVKTRFNTAFPGNYFDWYFLNDRVNAAYATEKYARNQIAVFTGLAIFISCLGLLGMMSILAAEKTKEIGIRKVLGAELHQIGVLLLRRSSLEILIALIIGIPIAYYLARQYLDRFVERITLEWWHFTLPVAVLILILLATIASMIWKAANSKPVEALKYE